MSCVYISLDTAGGHKDMQCNARAYAGNYVHNLDEESYKP